MTVACLLIASAMPGCATAPSRSPSPTTTATDPSALIEEVWSIVNEHFWDPDFNGVDWRAARQEALIQVAEVEQPDDVTEIIRRMLAKLRTSHMSYYTPDDREYYDLLDLFGTVHEDFILERFGSGGVRYDGIGIITERIDGRWHVVDVLPGHGGMIKVGDEILTVDGLPYEPVRSFRGRAGSRVAVTVQRSLSADSRLTVEPLVEWIHPCEAYRSSIWYSRQVLPVDGRAIAYVPVRSYAGSTMHDTLVRTITGDGPLAKAEALVLDLRGGWGGANPAYLDLFDDNVPTVTFLPRNRLPRTVDDRWRKPVVLLVDGFTRSGKEIYAYAFQKQGIGPVVGARTAGAVVGGRPFILSDGGLLMVAVNDVLVDGERLEGRGVEPDIKVDFTLPYAAGADPQLDAALRIAAERVAAGDE